MRAAAPPPGDLVIERARLTGNGGRSALEAALAHVRTGDVAGSGEILVIPRLHAREPLSALRSPGDFGARLTEQLRALRQAAAVDPAGPVTGAPALRFTSKARYAAWLVALWLGGRRAGSAREASAWPEPAVIRHWLRREVLGDGPVLVAAAARLLGQGQLAAWVARLDPAERALAAASLGQAYAVPSTAGASGPLAAGPTALPERASTPKRSRPSSPVDGAPYEAPAGRSIAASDGTSRRLRAAWTAITDAEPVAKALEPPLARLAHTLAVLAAHPNLGRELNPATLDRTRADVAEGPVRMPRRPDPERSAGAREGPQGGGRSSDEHRLPGHRGGRQHRRPSKRAVPPPRGSSVERLSAPARPAAGASSPLGPKLSAHAPTTAVEREPAADLPASQTLMPVAFGTAFGGVFFLANVLLALGLYPDFTRPRERGLAPSPFWLLDRLAERLFGRAYLDDPLHRRLADIGLPGPLPGAWEADPQWLSGLPRAPHGLRPSRARTILWDVRGFALVDAPLAAPRRRRAWLRRYARCGPCAALPPQPRRAMPRHSDARWIACLAEFVSVRLAMAGDGVGPHSLRLPASVTFDEERVEVAFDLARLPVEVRLAGLDRDPGWLPAEGRSLAFTFQ